jgi:GT2 family glycosyltransferase
MRQQSLPLRGRLGWGFKVNLKRYFYPLFKMAANPKVAVIILSWNGKHYLEMFLPSVCATPYPNIEIVVADNASTDDTEAFLKAYYPEITYLKLERNFGFAEGYNQAIKKVDTEYIVLLNQDVETSGDWISPLMKVMESDANIAAVQPKIKSFKDKNRFEYAGAAGGMIDKWGYPFCRGRILDACEKDDGQFNTVAEIAWASGACMLTRRSLYLKVGGFDADFFTHMEEIDLCWRYKNLGYKIMYCPDAEVYHVGGGSLPQGSPMKVYLNFRNNLAIITKNYNESLTSILIIRFFLDIVAALHFVSKFNFPQARMVLKAEKDFYLHFSKWKRKRVELMKSWSNQNHNGLYKHSIIWDYYSRGARKFSSLRK